MLEPAQVNNASIMLNLPSSLPVGAYSVAAGGSTPLIIGRPDLWWVQGDSGNRSTTGGWLRVFGRNIVLGSTKQPNPKDRLDASAVSEAISAAVQRGDFEAVERFVLLLLTRQVLERRSKLRTPTLTLTDMATNVALPPVPRKLFFRRRVIHARCLSAARNVSNWRLKRLRGVEARLVCFASPASC